MHIKNQRDFFSGLMFIMVGVLVAIGASTFPMGSAAAPGPGLLPLFLSALLALLGVIVLFKSLTIETEGGQPIGAWAWRPLLCVIAAVAVFALGLERLGWWLSVPLLVVIASAGRRGFLGWGLLVGAVAITVASWLIIVVGLQLPVPAWPAFGAG